MSARATATATARIADRAKAVPDADRGHRIRLYSLYVLAFATNLIGKRIIMIPSGNGINLQTFDINKALESVLRK